jgi:hypothetical protein
LAKHSEKVAAELSALVRLRLRDNLWTAASGQRAPQTCGLIPALAWNSQINM